MAAIPKPAETTVTRIFKSYEENAHPRFSRRLGASLIGHSCMRHLWYQFRWAKTALFPGRILRLFNKGHIEEPCVGADLKRIGVQWMPEDPETGKQWEFSELGDHFVCKLDGAACGFIEAPTAWHVIEIKTSADKPFKKLIKEGVEKAQPKHYAQCITGMGMSGMDRAAYIAVNKNDDDIHFERIKFNASHWKRLLQKAEEVIFCIDPPDKIANTPAWYECKFCQYSDICHDMGDIAEKNCRTCKYSTALEEGGWSCDNFSTLRTHEEQTEECPGHVYRLGMCGTTIETAAKILNAKISGESASKKIIVDDDNLVV